MPTPLNRVIIFVGDVQKCARFYRDHFGFKDAPSTDPTSAEWIDLETGGSRLALHKAHGPIDRPTGGPANPHKVVFLANDVEAERTRLVARGVPMGDVHRYGDVLLCDGTDPEGHVFQLCNR